jgi:NAD(P)-dependent dehydrogenase (short-subunit alcohol dehydrogenase family)
MRWGGYDWTGRQVLVTGAASGIGRATAVLAASRGAHLHLVDVAAAGLEETDRSIRASGGTVLTTQPLDVTDFEAVRAYAVAVTGEHGALDVVMNVAGISRWGTISGLENDDWRALVEVNLMGPVHVLETFVPPMVEAGRGGHVVNVSSAAGIIGMPWHAAYSASKFGLRGVSEVLRFDLARHGIGVSLVCPGGVDTGLTETIRIAGVDSTSKAFRRAQAGFRKRAVTPESAAASILKGVERDRYWVYTSLDIRAAHALQRLAPPAYVGLMHVFNRVANRVLPDVDLARAADQEPVRKALG